MKTAALLVSLTIATSGSVLAMAAECTTDELTSLSSLLSDAATKCPDLTSSSDLTAVCSDSDCVQAISSAVGDLPDCTVSGFNTKESLQTAIDGCEGTASDTGSASSIGAAFASTAIAATVVFAIAL
jgi:hypothetical protein